MVQIINLNEEQKRGSLSTDEEQIREFASNFTEAICNGNLDEIMSFYADDVVAYDIAPPLQIIGKEAYRKAWSMYTSNTKFPAQQEMTDISIECSGNSAFFRGLIRMSCQSLSGKQIHLRMRNTAYLKKIDSKWLIVHEHLSIPIDMNTEKPLWNLENEETLQ